MKKSATKQPVKLFFLQDLLMGNRTVYSGHSGTGKKLKMYQSDYGKYAMKPATQEECEKLRDKIEKAAKGLHEFSWNIVSIREITLCNFNSSTECAAFEKLQEEQEEIFRAELEMEEKHL